MTRTLFILALLLPLAAVAQPTGKVRVDTPWARASAGTTGAVYFTVRNEGEIPDKLVGASTPAARGAELHTMSMDGNVMRMRAVKEIPIAPHGTAELKPGGVHLMLTELKAPLKQGETFPLTLKFDKAGDVHVIVTVSSIGAMGPMAPGHHH
jgi:copper(I)-binding protein